MHWVRATLIRYCSIQLNNKILNLRYSEVPNVLAMKESLVESSLRVPLHISTLYKWETREVFPQKLQQELPLFDIQDILDLKHKKSNRQPYSLSDFLKLSARYLPNIRQKVFQWENSIYSRGRLVYMLLNHFSITPSSYKSPLLHVAPTFEQARIEEQKWDQLKLFQLPIIAKRNNQFMLILGIRWSSFWDIDKELDRMKSKGLYGLELNRHHWNNFPYFSRDGQESIRTIPPVTPLTPHHFIDKKKKKLDQLLRNTLGKPIPEQPSFRSWYFIFRDYNIPLVLDEFLMTPQMHENILVGRVNPMEYLLQRNPLHILNTLLRHDKHINDEGPSRPVLMEDHCAIWGMKHVLKEEKDTGDPIQEIIKEIQREMRFVGRLEHNLTNNCKIQC